MSDFFLWFVVDTPPLPENCSLVSWLNQAGKPEQSRSVKLGRHT